MVPFDLGNNESAGTNRLFFLSAPILDTLANGKILSAENTNLTGDPTTIYPVIVPPQPSPTAKSACMNKGWKTFTNPTFKNQGQCVKYVEHVINHHGK